MPNDYMTNPKRILILLPALVLAACGPKPEDFNGRFEKLANHYIEFYLRTNPEAATQLGDHRFDGLVYNFSDASVANEAKVAGLYLDSLAQIDLTKLDTVNQVDYQMLRSQLEYTRFDIDSLKELSWNTLAYNVGPGLYGLVSRDFAPLKDRLRSLRSRLQKIPGIVQQAEKNLQNPPQIYTETAMSQNDGNISLIQSDLDNFLAGAPDMKDSLADARQKAVEALTEYATFLKDTLMARSNGDFRLGDAKWQRKLHYTLSSDFSKEQILQSAEADLKKTQDDMYATAMPLFQKYFKKTAPSDSMAVIKAVLDKLAEDRPTNATIVALAKRDLDSTTAFVRGHHLASVPSSPVDVVIMPEFERGVAVAYCESPGPLEKNGKTFFTISPTPADWSPERVVSFYKEYNNYMVQDLTIHEAMPGHYVQLAHSNEFKAPTMVRAIFSSGSFVEGWATYAEQLMAREGYGGPEVKMEQMKMRLRLIINSIIDQKIHTEGMNQDDAIAIMEKEGFQEEGEAVGKWRRACLSSTQLSTYYVGNMEINDLVNRYKAKHPDADLQTIHDAILAYGSPPAKYVKWVLGLE